MNKDGIKDFYDILKMMEVLLYAQRWLETTENKPFCAQEAIIAQSEYLLNKLRILSVNHVGE